jgi:WD40 repeat protein
MISFKSLFRPRVETIVCRQQPRWSEKFIRQSKALDRSAPTRSALTGLSASTGLSELASLQRQLYARDYQDRLITVTAIFRQGAAGIPLLIEALRDPYGAVRDRAATYLQTFDRPEVHELFQVRRYQQVKCLHTLRGHGSGITAVAISPDNRTLLSSAGESTIVLWDIATGGRRQTLSAPDEAISQAIFSADGQWVISNSGRADILIWSIATGQVTQRLSGHTDRVTTLQLAPAGHNLFSGSGDGTIGVWDLTAGQLLERWSGHRDRIYTLAISPDGATVFSGGADGTIRHWQRQAGKPLRVYELGKTIVHALAAHPTQPILFSGDQQVRLSHWDYQTGAHLDTLPAWTYRPIRAIVLSPDGEVVLHNCGHGISIWHQPTHWFVHTLVHHRWAVSALAMSADGQTIVSGSDDQTVKIWGWR